ncbi:MAG: alpha-amylase family glycosyl hydrolase [Marinirhabdus sp.]
MKTAHENNMFVIIDWVPNHTGWDHPWVTHRPEYYTKNEKGEITDPINDNGEPWGWTDVADLDYGNPKMRQAMVAEMKYWVTEHNIDGFRCDVAHGVPASFWQGAIPELRKEKNIFMLAEAEIPQIMHGNLFEMSYAWEGHHILNQMAKGEKNVTAFDAYMAKKDTLWERDDILMNFVTNHDENAWAGPLRERMGDATAALTVLTYAMPGMPLVYSGQEYGLDKRLKFFENDSIPKERGSTYGLLAKLGTLKNGDPALHGGKNPAGYERIKTSDDSKILAFKRAQGDSEVIYIANLSPTGTTFTLPLQGTFTDVLNTQKAIFAETQEHKFAPWQYLLLTN